MFIEGNDQNSKSIWNYATILEKTLNWIALSNSIVGKCAPMQVIKQPGRTSTTEK